MKKRDGFLMIEVLVAFMIFSFFVLFVARTQVDIIKLNSKSKKIFQKIEKATSSEVKKEVNFENFVLPSEKIQLVDQKEKSVRYLAWGDLFTVFPKSIDIKNLELNERVELQ